MSVRTTQASDRWRERAATRLGLLVLVVLATLIPAGPAIAQPTDAGEADSADVVLWYFWGDGCPYCALASDWLEELRDEQPPALEVRELEVWYDQANQDRFVEMMAARGAEASGVPAFILDEDVWVGFSDAIAADIERAIEQRIDASAEATDDASGPAGTPSTLDLGPMGSVDVAAQPLAAATVMIAFVDGFNPCSLWVLTVLLAMILHTRSRLRIAAVGGTFLLVTAAIYGLFIAGLFAAFTVAGQLGWIQGAVAVLALAFAAVSIKDYFAYKQGLSFTIPDRFKPRIYRGGRAVRQDRPLPAILAITVAFAVGIALIELPCTAGFPVVWSNLVHGAGIDGAGFAGLLAVYLLVYLSVEVAIVVAALVTMRATRLQETHGRTLKLLGGAVMAAIAVVLLIDPTIMERLTGAVAVIGGGAAVAATVMLLDRHRRGAQAGSGT